MCCSIKLFLVMLAGTVTVKELESEQLNLFRTLDSPQPPTKEPPSDVVRPHVLKLESLEDGQFYVISCCEISVPSIQASPLISMRNTFQFCSMWIMLLL